MQIWLLRNHVLSNRQHKTQLERKPNVPGLFIGSFFWSATKIYCTTSVTYNTNNSVKHELHHKKRDRSGVSKETIMIRISFSIRFSIWMVANGWMDPQSGISETHPGMSVQ